MPGLEKAGHAGRPGEGVSHRCRTPPTACLPTCVLSRLPPVLCAGCPGWAGDGADQFRSPLHCLPANLRPLPSPFCVQGIPAGQEMELTTMIIECCSNEKTFIK